MKHVINQIIVYRFCQELGYYKEDALGLPIVSEDGSIDTVAMALRRRVFWSCFCLDKYAFLELFMACSRATYLALIDYPVPVLVVLNV